MKRGLALLAAVALLGGCGGGIALGFGSDDNPPSVSLAAGSTTASAGQTVQLLATASDDYAVVEVDFYRIDANGSTVFLGYDRNAPYSFDAVVPAGTAAGAVVDFYAVAYDDIGQGSDSNRVAVTVR